VSTWLRRREVGTSTWSNAMGVLGMRGFRSVRS
jgi:hypothetical protein